MKGHSNSVCAGRRQDVHSKRKMSSDSSRWMVRCILGLCLAAGAGCEERRADSHGVPPVAKAAPLSTATADTPAMLTADELRGLLGTDERATFRRVGTDIVEVSLVGAGVKSIEPLKGLPLRKLDLGFCSSIDDISVLAGMPLKTLILEGTSVKDLSPLQGMQLRVLYLQDTPVTDLSVTQGMPLEELNLKGVRVADVSPFANMPLSTIWLPQTEINDITPLSKLSLESLDIEDTSVSNLNALSQMTTLLRLNIAGTPITDIRPIAGLRLERIILTPRKITEGMDELRKIRSLEQIWTSHETRFSAEDFWERYDAGAWTRDSVDESDGTRSETEDQTRSAGTGEVDAE